MGDSCYKWESFHQETAIRGGSIKLKPTPPESERETESCVLENSEKTPVISSLAYPVMPSGPKKRKTAKKKKEEEDKPYSEGTDEGKIQDEKGSDGHNNRRSPVDVEDEGSENGARSESLRAAVDDHDAKHAGPKHVEFAKRSVDRSSSSDSSDDDSRVSEAKSEGENRFLKTNSDHENEQPGDSFDLIVQTSSVLHSIPAEVPASEEAIATAENASTQNSVIADVITSDANETEKTPLPVLPKSFENQKTSFLSCCGLFDAVSRSDR